MFEHKKEVEESQYDSRLMYNFECPSCNKLELKLKTEYSTLVFPVDYINGELVVDTNTGRVEFGIDDGEETTLFCNTCGQEFDHEPHNWIEVINKVSYVKWNEKSKEYEDIILFKKGESD
jgi:transcription elongation factor Elf1